jgi:hypothetical protein
VDKDRSENERSNNTPDQHAAQPAKPIGAIKYIMGHYNLTKAPALHG